MSWYKCLSYTDTVDIHTVHISCTFANVKPPTWYSHLCSCGIFNKDPLWFNMTHAKWMNKEKTFHPRLGTEQLCPIICLVAQFPVRNISESTIYHQQGQLPRTRDTRAHVFPIAGKNRVSPYSRIQLRLLLPTESIEKCENSNNIKQLNMGSHWYFWMTSI